MEFMGWLDLDHLWLHNDSKLMTCFTPPLITACSSLVPLEPRKEAMSYCFQLKLCDVQWPAEKSSCIFLAVFIAFRNPFKAGVYPHPLQRIMVGACWPCSYVLPGESIFPLEKVDEIIHLISQKVQMWWALKKKRFELSSLCNKGI